MPLRSTLASPEKGLCLLSLDAGGTRGISQLKILTELMHRLNFEVTADQLIRPCDVFDMIGGSGSGGFIAILLVVLRLNAEQALNEFIKLSVNILENGEMDHSARTAGLKTYIDKLLEKHEIRRDACLLDSHGHSKGSKLVIPISYRHHVGPTQILRNFDIHREGAFNMTVAEAVTATLASSPLFASTSASTEVPMFEYISADLTFDNPTRQIISEAYRTFGEEAYVACLLSIGCGHPGVIKSPGGADGIAWNHLLEKLVTDSEQRAEETESLMGHLGLYHRFSVTRGLERDGGIPVPEAGDKITHTMVYLTGVAVSRKLDLCAESLRLRNGVALLEQLKHTGGQGVIPPALPPLTRTFVMRRKPWDFVEKAMFGMREFTEANGPRMLVVTGMGGCGKTQLILMFIHVHKDKFTETFFIDGSSVRRIRGDTIRHVRALGVTHSQKGFEDSLLFLAQPCPGGPRLILYDNVDDPDISLAPLLPLGESCVIVIISRNRSIGLLSPGAHLELDIMSIDEAVDLLLYPSSHSTTITDHMREEAGAIAQELGCLPIALTQACNYMFQTQCSTSEYLERLLNNRDLLLVQPVKHNRDMRYLSTYAAFDASFALLSLRCQHLLRLLSYFHWSDFPLELVALAAKHNFSKYRIMYFGHGHQYYTGRAMLKTIFRDEGKWAITNLDEMIVSLRNHSLVTLTPGIGTKLVQMHPVAHGWVKSSIPERELAGYQAGAILLLALGARAEHTPSAQYLTSHITHLSAVWDQLHFNNTEAFAYILNQGGSFEGASQLRERMVAELRRQAEPDSMIIADSIWSLALTYRGLGRYKDAEELQMETLRLRMGMQGGRHPDTIMASSSLAITYRDLGQLREAETLQEQVLGLRNEILGDHHLDTISASSSLACTYYGRGRLKEAEVLQEDVLKLRTEILGRRHPDTIDASSNLALTYRDLDRLREAEMLQGEVLKLRKEILGERHPNTIDASSNLANTYSRVGQLKEAEALEEEVLKLRKEIFGERHPDTVKASNNLASTYRDLGRLKEAEELQEKVLRLRREILGERHPDTINASSNLAGTYYSLGRLKEAETLQEEVLQFRREILGTAHPNTINASSNLANTYYGLGRMREAEMLQEEVLRFRKEKLGEQHPETILAANDLADCYLNSGRLKDAETLQVETLRQAREILGNEHPATGLLMLTLSEIYESLHKKSNALDLLDAAEEVIVEKLGNDHPHYLECQHIRTRVQALSDTPTPVAALDPTPEQFVITTTPSTQTMVHLPRPRGVRRLIALLRGRFS